MRIVEGVTGLSVLSTYHLAANDSQSALCGETKVKERLIPFEHWQRKPFTLPGWWCQICDRLAKESQ